MSKSTYFVQECPTCGRNLQIRVVHMGKQVMCQHCRAQFQASDPGAAPIAAGESGLALINRANALLETADLKRAFPR
jgi:hypothetical protein